MIGLVGRFAGWMILNIRLSGFQSERNEGPWPSARFGVSCEPLARVMIFAPMQGIRKSSRRRSAGWPTIEKSAEKRKQRNKTDCCRGHNELPLGKSVSSSRRSFVPEPTSGSLRPPLLSAAESNKMAG